MSKQTFVVELATSDIVWLAWAAGVAAGQENDDASAALNAIMQRIQIVELPDDAESDPTEGPGWGVEPGDEENWENEGGAVTEAERTVDPQFSAGAVPAPPPMNRQADFGAGPPRGA